MSNFEFLQIILKVIILVPIISHFYYKLEKVGREFKKVLIGIMCETKNGEKLGLLAMLKYHFFFLLMYYIIPYYIIDKIKMIP